MPYADSQPQETPDRDWGGQLHQKIIPYSGHYRTNLSLSYKYIPKMKIFISKIKSTRKKYIYINIITLLVVDRHKLTVFYLKSIVMDSEQVGKAVFVK